MIQFLGSFFISIVLIDILLSVLFLSNLNKIIMARAATRAHIITMVLFSIFAQCFQIYAAVDHRITCACLT